MTSSVLLVLCGISVLLSNDLVLGETYTLGQFSIDINGNHVLVSHQSDSNRVVWQTRGEKYPFIRAGNALVEKPPILDGNYQLEEDIVFMTTWQTISSVVGDANMSTLTITGAIGCETVHSTYEYTFQLSLSEISPQYLSFDAQITTATNAINRLFLVYWTDAIETFHGFGESFTGFTMNGKRIPILVSEQGVGRGTEPITSYLNEGTEGVGGHWFTTYCPKPLYITSANRSVFFENSEVMFIDLTASGLVEAEVWALSIAGNIIAATSMRDTISQITLYTGRMLKPPQWSQEGAVVGLEGGTEEVSARVRQLLHGGVPISGVWLQDWVGMRHSWDGDRLIWNWEVNYDWYPGWQDMVTGWKKENIRVLTYVNPFFSDPSNFTNQSRHNFYQEGVDNGYFVKRADGSPYNMFSLSIEFCMVDLTNPEAVRWMKDIIKDYSLEEGMSSGWMADFGEYVPFDAVLHSGESAAAYHNRYPEEWARLTLEVLTENNRQEDVLFFMRSAWMKSPAYNSLFWEGDQLVNWDENDGLKSVVLGALSGGLSGHAITHSDIGGYTVTSYPVPGCTFMRSEELLNRWAELSAFGAGLFRTHVGSSTSTDNFNVYDSPESIKHFAQFASIYGALRPYRDRLFAEAMMSGLPLIRPLAMNYAYDHAAWEQQEEYLFGDDFLVAPSMDEGAVTVDVYIPSLSGSWVHLWSDRVISSTRKGHFVQVSAPVGFPPVFYKEGSSAGEDLRSFVLAKGYCNGDPVKYVAYYLESASYNKCGTVARVDGYVVMATDTSVRSPPKGALPGSLLALR